MNYLAACIWLYASQYGTPQATASGEPFTGKELTMALRYLPIKRWYFVEYKGKTITVWANDRGPFVKDRKADISFEVAKQLEFKGLDFICVRPIL
jgi:rare lipoprotein A (peptidoglycan hydrolase)